MKGKTVKQIREVLALTQVELAERIGVNSNTVARWERDEVPIPPTAYKLLLTFIDINTLEKLLVP